MNIEAGLGTHIFATTPRPMLTCETRQADLGFTRIYYITSEGKREREEKKKKA